MKKLLTILFLLCAVQSFAQYPGPYQGTQRSNLLYTSKVKFTGAAWFTDSTYLQGYARTSTPADGDSSLRIPTTGWVTKNYQPYGTGWLIGGNSDAAPPYIGTWANKELIFITDSAERMKIPANGILRSSSLRNKVLSIDTLTKDIYYTDPTAGAGTVTSVSRTNGYGISASVTNATTTPDITITLDTATVFPAVRATIPGGGGTTYTSDNGITLTSSNFKLGGALTGATNITGNQALSLGISSDSLASLTSYAKGNSVIRSGAIAGLYSATRSDLTSNTQSQVSAPLITINPGDSAVLLNQDEAPSKLPFVVRASNGRLYKYTNNDDVAHLSSDFTTSSTTAVSTNLTFAIAASESYKVTITGTASKATSSSGLKLAIAAPSGCTIKGVQYAGGATLSSALTNSLITAINTLGSTFATGTGVEVPFRMEFIVTNSTTPGSITLQAATVTSNTATIYAGTTMEWHKSTGL